ncbi:hypothetical protein SRB5_69310 [Streptomyces sp. RB5]|uniref:Uncharacterized protein n=1 Tax=Streptomyces smaragdinus TaxID=2585196 RepID=A0A7K0CTD9_9ACTN|nr:hypothetical protein [Streptomyces smaragdinus]
MPHWFASVSTIHRPRPRWRSADSGRRRGRAPAAGSGHHDDHDDAEHGLTDGRGEGELALRGLPDVGPARIATRHRRIVERRAPAETQPDHLPHREVQQHRRQRHRAAPGRRPSRQRQRAEHQQGEREHRVVHHRSPADHHTVLERGVRQVMEVVLRTQAVRVRCQQAHDPGHRHRPEEQQQRTAHRLRTARNGRRGVRIRQHQHDQHRHRDEHRGHPCGDDHDLEVAAPHVHRAEPVRLRQSRQLTGGDRQHHPGGDQGPAPCPRTLRRREDADRQQHDGHRPDLRAEQLRARVHPRIEEPLEELAGADLGELEVVDHPGDDREPEQQQQNPGCHRRAGPRPSHRRRSWYRSRICHGRPTPCSRVPSEPAHHPGANGPEAATVAEL